MIIRTERLDLVPLAVEHAEEMAAVLADPDLFAYIEGKPPSVAELRKSYRRRVAGSPDPAVAWHNWVVRLRAEGCLTGVVQATITAGAVAELSWMVGSPWQGRGIASEAARGLTDWLTDRGVASAIAHIHPDHHASASVARSAGLAPTERMHEGEVEWRRELRT